MERRVGALGRAADWGLRDLMRGGSDLSRSWRRGASAPSTRPPTRPRVCSHWAQTTNMASPRGCRACAAPDRLPTGRTKREADTRCCMTGETAPLPNVRSGPRLSSVFGLALCRLVALQECRAGVTRPHVACCPRPSRRSVATRRVCRSRVAVCGRRAAQSVRQSRLRQDGRIHEKIARNT